MDTNEKDDSVISTTDDIEKHDAEAVSEINGFGDAPEEKTGNPDVEAEGQEEQPSEEAKEDDQYSMKAPNNVRVAPNVHLKYPVYKPDERPDTKRPMSVIFVPKRLSNLEENPEAWAVTRNDANSPHLTNFVDRWMYGISQQHGVSYTDNGFFDSTLDDPDAKWEQGFRNEDGRDVYLRKAELSLPSKQRILTGSAARDRISASIGVGISTRIPLPHTGFHVALNARSTQDYLDLDYMLTLDKTKAGRDTVGIIYQNSHIALVKRVWEFIRESVKHVNRQNFADIDLGDDIRVTDFPILQWGMACTMYPDGYPLDLPCSSGPNICQHVERVNLDLDKLLWINTAGLAPSQRSKLGNASHPLSEMEIKEYQENAAARFSKTFKVNDAISMELKVPTINEYIRAGEEWINNITQAAYEVFGNEEENEGRIRAYVERVIEMSSLREYSHWIAKITINELDIITDNEAICESLDALSGNKELVAHVLEQIQAFIEKATIALIAIPNFACPKCEKDHVTDEHSTHPELIPMDMMKHFFTLKDRRLAVPMPNRQG